MQQIRRLYPAVMGKSPFYSTLVEELVEEDHANDRDTRRKALLAKLQVSEQRSAKKNETVNTKEMLMEAVRSLSALTPQLDQVLGKIRENHDSIEDLHNSFWDKFIQVLRKAFNIPDPPVDYQIYISDPVTQTEHPEKISYLNFISDLARRSRFYASFSAKMSPAYRKIENSKPEAIVEFLNKQIGECQRLYTQLSALDDFFKNALQEPASQHIKGMKIELAAMKNTLVKANQRRAEYISYIEEEAQMKKLGIQDVD
jgi:hypothetical protein